MAMGEVLPLGDGANHHLGEGHAGQIGQGRAHLVALLHGLVHLMSLVVQFPGVHPAAHGIEAPGQGLDHGLHPPQHHDVAEAGPMPAGIDDGRAGGAELAGDAGDGRGRDAGDLRRPVGGIGFQLVELGLEDGLGRSPRHLEVGRHPQAGGEGVAIHVLVIEVAELVEGPQPSRVLFHHQGPALVIRDLTPLALVVAGEQEGQIGVAAQEIGVVEPLLHQGAHQRQHEGQVGARADLQPLVGLGRGL